MGFFCENGCAELIFTFYLICRRYWLFTCSIILTGKLASLCTIRVPWNNLKY